MRFEKWQALGNDYVIDERDQQAFELTPARINAICLPHLGVGADGLLLLERSDDPDIVARLTIFNADGSRAELSGNGAREAILYLRHRGWTDRDEFTIQTDAGPVTPTITGPFTCRVDMGAASLQSDDYPSGAPDGIGRLKALGRSWTFQHVSIGNPQCAIPLDDPNELEALDLPSIGPKIERHPLFPKRTNVSWYVELTPDRVAARIFERGVGETLSSGTGAIGIAVAHLLRTQPDATRWPPVLVALEGGELGVKVDRESMQVQLAGWAKPVYAGALSDTFITEPEGPDETE